MTRGLLQSGNRCEKSQRSPSKQHDLCHRNRYFPLQRSIVHRWIPPLERDCNIFPAEVGSGGITYPVSGSSYLNFAMGGP